MPVKRNIDDVWLKVTWALYLWYLMEIAIYQEKGTKPLSMFYKDFNFSRKFQFPFTPISGQSNNLPYMHFLGTQTPPMLQQNIPDKFVLREINSLMCNS